MVCQISTQTIKLWSPLFESHVTCTRFSFVFRVRRSQLQSSGWGRATQSPSKTLQPGPTEAALDRSDFKQKCLEEDSVQYCRPRFSAPPSGQHPCPLPRRFGSDPFSSCNAIALIEMEALAIRVSEPTVFWAWTICATRCPGSRRPGKAVGLGPVRVRLQAEVIRVRRPEGLESLVSKVVRLHYDVACPSEGLRTPSASRFRCFFSFYAIIVVTSYCLFDFLNNIVSCEPEMNHLYDVAKRNSSGFYRKMQLLDSICHFDASNAAQVTKLSIFLRGNKK